MRADLRGKKLYSCQNLKKLKIIPKDFRKNTYISNFMEIRPVGAELFHADKHDEANSRFSQLCERA
jgi:hypothetical protein